MGLFKSPKSTPAPVIQEDPTVAAQAKAQAEADAQQAAAAADERKKRASLASNILFGNTTAAYDGYTKSRTLG